MIKKHYQEMDTSGLDVKYRPTAICELVGQPRFSRLASSWIHDGNIPHLLFVGPPGVGKTSAARVLAIELFGETNWTTGLITYNASDFGGVDIVRKSIDANQRLGCIYTAYKIILLDEVDSLTEQAQHALKSKMEHYTNNAKFILCCNNESKIIEPIKSRCFRVQFELIPDKDIVDRLSEICRREKITPEPGALEKIAIISHGVLRDAIVNLAAFKGFDDSIKVEDVDSIVKLETLNVKTLMNKALSGELIACDEIIYKIYSSGQFNAKNILNECFNITLNNKQINQLLRFDIIEQISIHESRISFGTDQLLQIRCFCSSLARCNSSQK